MEGMIVALHGKCGPFSSLMGTFTSDCSLSGGVGSAGQSRRGYGQRALFPTLFKFQGKFHGSDLWFLYYSKEHQNWAIGLRKDVHMGAGWLRSSLCDSPEDLIVHNTTKCSHPDLPNGKAKLASSISPAPQPPTIATPAVNASDVITKGGKTPLAWQWFDRDKRQWKTVHQWSIRVLPKSSPTQAPTFDSKASQMHASYSPERPVKVVKSISEEHKERVARNTSPEDPLSDALEEGISMLVISGGCLHVRPRATEEFASELAQVPVLNNQNEHDQSAGFKVGQAVQARWKSHADWLSARVVGRNDDGTYRVLYYEFDRVPERERQLAMHMLGPEGITSDHVLRHNIRDHSAAGETHVERDGVDSADMAALAILGIEERNDTPPHGDGHGLATISEDVPFEAEKDTDTYPAPSERKWWCLLTSNPSTCVTAQHVERDSGDFSPPPGLDCTELFARHQLRGRMPLSHAVEIIGEVVRRQAARAAEHRDKFQQAVCAFSEKHNVSGPLLFEDGQERQLYAELKSKYGRTPEYKLPSRHSLASFSVDPTVVFRQLQTVVDAASDTSGDCMVPLLPRPSTLLTNASYSDMLKDLECIRLRLALESVVAHADLSQQSALRHSLGIALFGTWPADSICSVKQILADVRAGNFPTDLFDSAKHNGGASVGVGTHANGTCYVRSYPASIRSKQDMWYRICWKTGESDMLSENELSLRGRGTSNSTTSLVDEIDPVSPARSLSSSILETEADDCVAAMMPEGGGKRAIFGSTEATFANTFPGANAGTLTKGGPLTRSDVLAATAPFENVFTPVRLNRAADRLEWVVHDSSTGAAHLVIVPLESVDGLQLGMKTPRFLDLLKQNPLWRDSESNAFSLLTSAYQCGSVDFICADAFDRSVVTTALGTCLQDRFHHAALRSPEKRVLQRLHAETIEHFDAESSYSGIDVVHYLCTLIDRVGDSLLGCTPPTASPRALL